MNNVIVWLHRCSLVWYAFYRWGHLCNSNQVTSICSAVFKIKKQVQFFNDWWIVKTQNVINCMHEAYETLDLQLSLWPLRGEPGQCLLIQKPQQNVSYFLSNHTGHKTLKIPFFSIFKTNCNLKITRSLLEMKFDRTYLSLSVTKTNHGVSCGQITE